MLRELVVENYAVIEQVRVCFHAGLNLLTGETGSGKSIVVDALGLLLGGRASADMVRSGASRARVAGIFEVRDCPALHSVLDPVGIEIEDGELLIEREILAEGKSRAYLGSRPVAVSILKDLGPALADIHGQHDQQLLFSSDAQRDMLDMFAGGSELVDHVASIYRQWRAAGVTLAEIEQSEQEKLRLVDLWCFQRKEIEAAGLQPGEDLALENERRVLQNVQRLQEAAGAAYAALYDSPESALSLTLTAGKRVEDLCRIDSSMDAVREHLRTAAVSLEEASYVLRDYVARLEANPGRLDEVENRLAAMDRLKRKYGKSAEEILTFLEEVRTHLASVENAGERMEALRAQQKKLSAEFEKQAAELTAARRAAANKLQKRVEAELAQLAMERTTFRVEITPAAWAAHGADRIDFLVSANLGEEPRALDKVASGGEISRIALALKTCLSGPKSALVRTLVFDEVDAGVGGAAAEGIGRRLKKLAAANQVLCVTHLPQIASFADHHYRVEKREADGRTIAAIEELDGAARTREVGRMLSGQRLTPEALKHAEQLIRMSE
ncbi:MAG TPA: DNA repair protein RecN [Bryobacteraceae bacterium]|jgi:DNA repair protein RecN (Recombination protein N)|nr:DNA repair protein RecN [Bryobacteraceae bacterium]